MRGCWRARCVRQHRELRHGAEPLEAAVTGPLPWLVLGVALALTVAQPRSASAIGETDVKAGPCGIAGGGDVKNNIVSCNNYGLTNEQLKEATKAAVAGA